MLGDCGYDAAAIRRGLRTRHIVPWVALRRTAHGSGLGRWRWVVERTFAWLNQFRRLRVRYDKRADIHEAFLSLGCALICWRCCARPHGPLERMPTVLLRTSPGRRFPASIASTPLLWGLPGPNPGNRSTLRRVRGVVRPRRNGTRIIAQTLALSPGTRLGPYEVTIQIGVGGMGEVYRATDTNLKRSVAIKVLPASVAADAERLARFQREAEVLAALNHSNIAQIYGLEKREGTIALVMELVEGPTLADRIATGAMPIDEAVPVAKQITCWDPHVTDT